jgi:hypothetical protein
MVTSSRFLAEMRKFLEFSHSNSCHEEGAPPSIQLERRAVRDLKMVAEIILIEDGSQFLNTAK